VSEAERKQKENAEKELKRKLELQKIAEEVSNFKQIMPPIKSVAEFLIGT
jgi:hypothetical protein